MIHKLSVIFRGIKNPDSRVTLGKDLISKSTKLFSDEGLLRTFEGRTVILPFLFRSLRKLEEIIREEMEKLSAYQIVLPALMNMSLLEKSEREITPELFQLTDRKHRKFILSPTHEEVITDLMASESQIREKSLPIRLYQISTKFRDEAHAKHGLIRTKEFIMKDLYCFDSSVEARENTYHEVCNHYKNVFDALKIPYVCVISKDSMNPVESHEYHFFSEFGDELMICENCGHSTTLEKKEAQPKCEKCSSKNVTIRKGIEVGHTFNIGTYFSEKLNATFIDKKNSEKYLEMSSYGIGVSRILGAAVEVLCKDNQIKWPAVIAPYLVCIIPAKGGSKEEESSNAVLSEICCRLNHHINGDIVIDDRIELTIGKRLMCDKKLGFPIIVVLGKSINDDDPTVEIHDTHANEKHFISPSGAPDFILMRLSQM